MAYCLKCGAYIPDGQIVCLACGYDPNEEKREQEKQTSFRAGSAAAQYSSKNEELRRRLEEQRKRNREQNRQWAEQEKARREQQASNRKWAEEEYARRQAERERQAQQYVNRSRTGYQTGSAAGTGNKALASLSYLSVLFALPYFLTPDDQYAKYHARQGLKLFIFGILADILGGLTGLGWIVTLARFFFMYKGISNAASGKMEPLPYIGTIGDSQ